MNKKFFAVALSLLMVLSVFGGMAVLAEEGEVIFADSFETPFTDLPKEWTYFGANSEGNVKADTTTASDGKYSVRITEESNKASSGLQSKQFKVEAGKTYTASVDSYIFSGQCHMFLKYFDAAGKQLFSKSVSNALTGKWTTISISEPAPANSVTGSVVLCVNKAATGVGCYDNVKVQSGKVSVSQPADSGEITNPPVQSAPVNAKLVAPDGNGLKYMAYNEQGDTLSDFSYAGFYAGEIDLPDTSKLPVIDTIKPSTDSGADDTGRLQEIIDRASASIPDGEMGVVKVEEGRYNINKKGLQIKNGVVLSGSGQGPNGTVFFGTDKSQYTVLKASGNQPAVISEKADITDDYVKSGSAEINIAADKIGEFAVGDTIVIYHPSSSEWVKGMEMSSTKTSAGADNSWKEGSVDMTTERTIKAINGTTITLDFPMFVPLDKKYTTSYIYKIDESTKITNFGVENLRVESYYNGNADDEEHANVAIGLSNAKNGFIRNVSAKHFILSAVRCGANTKQITVQNCSSLEPVSKVAGSRRYSFSCTTSAQQILFTGCYSFAGRHDYMSSYSSTGPLAFVDNIAEDSTNASETHGTWTTGLLYDNVYCINAGNYGFIALSNRGIYGTSLSQGWTGAGCVAWNSLAPTIIAHKPSLTYQNFMVGTWGRYLDDASLAQKAKAVSAWTALYHTDNVPAGSASDSFFQTTGETPFVGDAYQEAPTTPVEPRSLFKAQLALRLTGDMKNVKPNAPILVSPKAEAELTDKTVSVSGIYQMGAEKVTVYVDDKATDAVLDSATNTFALSVPLADGWHKIYSTQTINGVEGTKGADRFILVGQDDKGNPNTLLSVYPREKTALITADNRKTFDEVMGTSQGGEADQSIKILVNGKKLTTDVEPFETNDRVLVPMRAIFEALGATVDWDEASATATAVKDGTEIKITENSDIAFKNGAEVKLDVTAMIVQDRFMVPVRFISESFGAEVDWIDRSKTVTVNLSLTVYPPAHNIPNALTVKSIKGSGDDGAGNVIENIFDGNFTSRWAFQGEGETAWGIFDLGAAYPLDKIMIAFYSGNKRAYSFSIDVSEDGVNYTRVLENASSSGASTELESFDLKGVKARYVKYIGAGNSVNAWNNITELTIIEKK